MGNRRRRRPRRRASRNSFYKTPSSAHYAGYVEDDECIESIMKKFEALEQFKEQLRQKDEKKENAGSEEASDVVTEEKQEVQLNQQHLEQIFKITSGFSMN